MEDKIVNYVASLDRIDNNGHYEPSNVQWSTYSEQNVNKRKRVGTSSKYRGLSWDSVNNKWHVRAGGKCLGRFAKEANGALVYNQYVIDNSLGLPLNDVKEINEDLQLPSTSVGRN